MCIIMQISPRPQSNLLTSAKFAFFLNNSSLSSPFSMRNKLNYKNIFIEFRNSIEYVCRGQEKKSDDVVAD